MINMKKILIIIISIILFVPSANAVNYYQSVNIKTSFAEEINISDIKTIEAVFEDASEYSKSYILTRDENFTLNLENIPIGPFSLRYSIVNDDVIGYYNVQAIVNEISDTNSLDVLLKVEIQNNQKKDNLSNIVSNLIEEINNPSNKTNSSSTNQPNKTTTAANNSGIIIDDDENHDTTRKTTTTSLTYDEIEEARQQEQKEKERLENRKRNNLVGIILFSVVGGFLLIALLAAIIKISKANK